MLAVAVASLALLLPAPSPLRGSRACVRGAEILCCDAAAPSDVDDFDPDLEPFPPEAFPEEDPPPEIPAVAAEDIAATAEQRAALKAELLSLAAACTRGESATEADRSNAQSLVAMLEGMSPIAEPTLAPECNGTWELVFSDTQLFRSSPFFMAGRAVCADGEEAARYDWFCEMHRQALAISTIGKVRQVVSRECITSEFETKAGAVPFLSDYTPFAYSGGLPFTISGSIVSTASIEGNLGDSWRLLMDTVEIKGSNLPLLRQALDGGVKLRSRALGRALEEVVPSYANPRPLFKTTYLDGQMRISRDQDGKLFVYVKQSDSTTPTDYGAAPADLGVGALLSGIRGALF